MALIEQITQLQDGISGYAAKDPVPWQLAQITNALVQQAKELVPDNPTLSAIDDFRPSSSAAYAARADIGTVRAVLSQLYALLPGDA